LYFTGIASVMSQQRAGSSGLSLHCRDSNVLQYTRGDYLQMPRNFGGANPSISRYIVENGLLSRIFMEHYGPNTVFYMINLC
jgi:hypothetical protein